MRRLLIVVLPILLLTSCLADLRPKNYDGGNENKASIMLLKAAKKHGYSPWSKVKEYECTIEDSFFGFVGKQGSPFKESSATMKAVYKRGKHEGTIIIVSGKEDGKIWSVNQDVEYTNNKNGDLIRVEDKKIAFWVPTYQYFAEFSFRIIEATAQEYLGKKERNGQMYDIVLASWNTTEPQKDIDQYLVWINKSGKIEYVDYTIRDQFKFLTGTAHFVSFDRPSGFDVPSQIDVYSNLTGKRMMHQMKFTDLFVTKR